MTSSILPERLLLLSKAVRFTLTSLFRNTSQGLHYSQDDDLGSSVKAFGFGSESYAECSLTLRFLAVTRDIFQDPKSIKNLSSSRNKVTRHTVAANALVSHVVQLQETICDDPSLDERREP